MKTSPFKSLPHMFKVIKCPQEEKIVFKLELSVTRRPCIQWTSNYEYQRVTAQLYIMRPLLDAHSQQAPYVLESCNIEVVNNNWMQAKNLALLRLWLKFTDSKRYHPEINED